MGMLDTLFQTPNPGTFQLGSLGAAENEDDPRFNVPAFDDYSQGVPVRRGAKKVFDDDLKKFQETHPITPETAAAQASPMLQQPDAPPSNPSGLPAPPIAPGQPFTGPARTMAGMVTPGGGIDTRPPAYGALSPEMGGPFGAVPAAAAPAAAPAAPAVAPAPHPVAPAAPPIAARPPAVAPQSPDVAASPPQRATYLSSQQRPTMGSPAEGAIDLTDAAPNVLGKVWQGIKDNSGLLMGLGAGLTGAPSWAVGASRGFAGAAAGAQADYKQNFQQGSAQQLYTALVSAGVPRQQAVAATTSPKLADALIQSYVTDRGKSIQMVKSKDPWGGETEVPYIVNKFPRDGEPMMTPAFPTATGGAGSAPGVGGAANQTGSMTFAPGVNETNFDHSKFGDEYLAQYSPEMQDWVKNYLAGNGIPTGRQGSSQMIKAAAMKYGTDIGMPPDDASIGQRKIWSNSLGDTSKGVGLQAKGLQQGLEHFVKLSDNLVKMNLSNGMGIEPVAGWINGAKNLTTAQQELVHKTNIYGQALAREMGNLFSKNGGGVHEAAETKQNLSSATMSSKSAAGSLDAVDNLMQGGIKALVQRRDELFPHGNAPRGSNFMGPEQESALAHIRKNIAILKGEQPASEDAAPAGGVAGPKKIKWNVVQ